VTDRATGKPIAGATVTVLRSLLGDPRYPDQLKALAQTKHKTDAEGKYRFNVPVERGTEQFLYVEVDVEHPGYAPEAGFGYTLGEIGGSEAMGRRPLFEWVRLDRGEAVTGRVETPDGKPAVGVLVSAVSISAGRSVTQENPYSIARTTTDKAG